jgi:hypothetical protein
MNMKYTARMNSSTYYNPDLLPQFRIRSREECDTKYKRFWFDALKWIALNTDDHRIERYRAGWVVEDAKGNFVALARTEKIARTLIQGLE